MQQKRKKVTSQAIRAEIEQRQFVRSDFAIKYLLKNRVNYTAINGILTAVLSTVGHPPVQIKGLLDPESHMENSKQKKSVADVMLEGSTEEIYIVEIQQVMNKKIHRKGIFNTARATIDCIPSGADYNQLKKIFHITILFFVPDYIHEVLSHQKSNHVYVISQKPVQWKEGCSPQTREDIENYPESFVIAVPLFNGIINGEETKNRPELVYLNELLYFLKESEIKDDFTSPYMKELKKRLTFANLSPKEQREYISFMKAQRTDEYRFDDVRAEGEARGKAEGIKTVALNLLKYALPLEVITEATGLSAAEIEQLKVTPMKS